MHSEQYFGEVVRPQSVLLSISTNHSSVEGKQQDFTVIQVNGKQISSTRQPSFDCDQARKEQCNDYSSIPSYQDSWKRWPAIKEIVDVCSMKENDYLVSQPMIQKQPQYIGCKDNVRKDAGDSQIPTSPAPHTQDEYPPTQWLQIHLSLKAIQDLISLSFVNKPNTPLFLLNHTTKPTIIAQLNPLSHLASLPRSLLDLILPTSWKPPVEMVPLTLNELKTVLLAAAFQDSTYCIVRQQPFKSLLPFWQLIQEQLSIYISNINEGFLLLRRQRPDQPLPFRNELEPLFHHYCSYKNIFFPTNQPHYYLRWNQLNSLHHTKLPPNEPYHKLVSCIAEQLCIPGAAFICLNDKERDVVIKFTPQCEQQSLGFMKRLSRSGLLTSLTQECPQFGEEDRHVQIDEDDLQRFTGRRVMKHYLNQKEPQIAEKQSSLILSLLSSIECLDDILQLSGTWEEGVVQELSHAERNWYAYGEDYQQAMRDFAKLGEYYSVRSRIYLLDQRQRTQEIDNSDTSQQYAFVDLLQKAMNGLDSICRQINRHLQEPDIDQLFIEYIVARPEIKHRNIRDNRNGFLKHYQSNILRQKKRKQKIMDQILFFFMREYRNMHQGIKRNIVLSLNNGDSNQTVPLSKYTTKIQEFYNATPKWYEIFTVITYLFTIWMPKHRQQFKKQELRRKMNEQMARSEFEWKPSVDCLGCSLFFYLNENIKDIPSLRVPTRFFGPVEELQGRNSELTDEIVGFLNSGGGVILFDVEQKYLEAFPVGCYITERKKEEYEQRIKSCLNYVPHADSSEVVVDFVPIKKNSLDSQPSSGNLVPYLGVKRFLKGDQGYRAIDYVEGKYVTRVKVKPQSAGRVYYWIQRGTSNLHFVEIVNGAKLKMGGRRIARLIKRRFTKKQIMQRYSPEERAMFYSCNDIFNHTCGQPERGIPIRQLPLRAVDSQNQPLTYYQQRHSYASLLIAGNRHHEQVLSNLRRDHIECHLEVLFQRYHFKSAHNTALLYHSSRFEELIRVVSMNPRYQFYGRSIVVISITPYLKLVERTQFSPLSAVDMDRLRDWLWEEFPEERLACYEFRTYEGRGEWYLQTESKASTLFLYYMLNHFGQRVHFKNPLHLDKMSESERKQRFIQRYLFLPPTQLIPQSWEPLIPGYAKYQKQNQLYDKEKNPPQNLVLISCTQKIPLQQPSKGHSLCQRSIKDHWPQLPCIQLASNFLNLKQLLYNDEGGGQELGIEQVYRVDDRIRKSEKQSFMDWIQYKRADGEAMDVRELRFCQTCYSKIVQKLQQKKMYDARTEQSSKER